MSTYLVTGAAGFIASRVCELLLADGHVVVGIDNLNDYYDVRLKYHRLARLAALAGCDPQAVGALEERVRQSDCAAGAFRLPVLQAARFVYRPLDIEHLAELDGLFDEFRFDAVFNLAARAGVRYSMEFPHVYLSTNIEGMLNVLECQRKHGVVKQVLASSSSLYAGSPLPFTEDQPVNRPQSPYAASKKAAEMMAYSYHQLYGLDLTVVRYFTVFGPAGRPDMAPLRFIKWIDEGTPIALHGDGSQARDFTFIDDIARGTLLAVKPLGYEVINLGGGRNPVSLRAMIALIERALGKTAQVVSQPSHAADMHETWADIAKAGRLLGWAPQVTLEAGVQLAVDWHRANREWLRDIRV